MNQTRAFSLACSLLLTAPLALAQGQGGPIGPPGGLDGPPRMERHEGRGMGIVPHGTWWRNPNTIQALGLSSDQQKHLDDIFLQSRIQLIHMHASLEEEQLKLEPLLNANPPDQNRALAEISKIADLRADLEKADAKMLLSLRGVLTADQWTKLQTEPRMHHEDRGMPRGPRNFNGPGGPGGAPGRPNNPDGPPTLPAGPAE
jgi:Spy/CpxP family protein refolding chaperone